MAPRNTRPENPARDSRSRAMRVVGRPRKVTDADIAEILAWHAARETCTQLARRLGLSQATIRRVVRTRGRHYKKEPPAEGGRTTGWTTPGEGVNRGVIYPGAWIPIAAPARQKHSIGAPPSLVSSIRITHLGVRNRPDANPSGRAYSEYMALYRHRSVQMLAGLALGLQLLIASGLAMSAPSAHCGSAHSQTMGGDDCQTCGTYEHGNNAHSDDVCKVACAPAGLAAPLPLRVFTMQAPRDAAPTSAVSLEDQSTPDDLLRPPAGAAARAA